MGFIGICIDFVWPLIALGYPMFASIRAIQTGSGQRVRKLVIYWILFSPISLSEFGFVGIIEWIPFWSSIKLMAIFWLVKQAACDAYEYLIRPSLYVDRQAFSDRFYSPMEENELCNPDMVEQCIEESGHEAFEHLISSKHDSKEPHNSERGIQVLEPVDEDAAAKVATTRLLEIPSWREEWRFDLCKVKMTSEEPLNAHPQVQDNIGDAKGKVGQGSQQESTKKKQDTVFTQPFKLWCNICHVKLLSEIDLASHLKGKRHLANIQDALSTQLFKLWCNVCHAKLPGEIDLASHIKGKRHSTNIQDAVSTKQCKLWCNVCHVKLSGEIDLASHLKGKRHSTNIQDVVSTPPFKVWCNVCHVKLPGEMDLASHLKGKRHLANIQDDVSTRQFKLWCNVCHVKLLSEIDLASHLKGKRHLANIQDDVSTRQFKLWCNICHVKLPGEIDMASHLKGKRHLTNIHKAAKL